MTEEPKGFLAQLELSRSGADRWSGWAGGARVTHGLVAAQAMSAAGATTDTGWRWVHSVHMTRLADGDPEVPIEYRVDRLSDTVFSANRLVHAWQGEQRLATVTLAFQAPRPDLGPHHQTGACDEDAPDPHSLRSDLRGHEGAPIDVRYVDRAPNAVPGALDAGNRMWVRFTEELPDRLLPHAAALVHAADALLIDSVDHPGLRNARDLETGSPLQAVGLDLLVRFHRTFRADDWLLLEQGCPSMSDYRALSTGAFYSSLGRLVATVSQETALLPTCGG